MYVRFVFFSSEIITGSYTVHDGFAFAAATAVSIGNIMLNSTYKHSKAVVSFFVLDRHTPIPPIYNKILYICPKNA